MTNVSNRAMMALIQQSEAKSRETCTSKRDSRLSTFYLTIKAANMPVLSELFTLRNRSD